MRFTVELLVLLQIFNSANDVIQLNDKASKKIVVRGKASVKITNPIKSMYPKTDFTYFKIIGWGWYYLSTILDDYSRYIVHWELCSNMKADDVTRTIDSALEKASLDKNNSPRLLSDNDSCYVSSELAKYIKDKRMSHVRGRPMHPQTQGKIERWHRSMKNVVKLENYYLPGDLINRLEEFVEYYNNERYHESLKNLIPADVYFGRGHEILKQRHLIKLKTMKKEESNTCCND